MRKLLPQLSDIIVEILVYIIYIIGNLIKYTIVTVTLNTIFMLKVTVSYSSTFTRINAEALVKSVALPTQGYRNTTTKTNPNYFGIKKQYRALLSDSLLQLFNSILKFEANDASLDRFFAFHLVSSKSQWLAT